MPDRMRQQSPNTSAAHGIQANGASLKRHSGNTNGYGVKNSISNGVKNGISNGTSVITKQSWHGHDREEVARLLIQGLQDLGYHDSMNALIRESGYELESPAVAAFRESVIRGEWSEAEALLFGSAMGGFSGSIANGHGSLHQGLPLADGVDEHSLRFQLRRQKYLELLEIKDHAGALTVLRQELTPLHQDINHLHLLSGLMVCATTEDLQSQAMWDGAQGTSRSVLLQELSRAISPSVMIPRQRLATILTQVKQSQVAKCHYHNPVVRLSLFADHVCDRDQYPLQSIHELHNSEEVWHLQFSHDGTRLASCGQMHEITIWDTSNFKEALRLLHHTHFVAFLAWSPDDTKLVSCSNDKTAKIWDTRTGIVLHTIPAFQEPVSAAAWSPDGRYLMTASLDRQGSLYQWTDQAEQVHKWNAGYRINALAISPDGERMVVLSSDFNMHIYNFQTREEMYVIKLYKNLTSVSISRDSKSILVNMAGNALQLIDMENADVIEGFKGHTQDKLTIRSSFGGGDETLVITGSENGKIYVFNKDRGTLIEEVSGHIGPVNAIAWNPVHPCQFASAGDDRKIRIWIKPPGGPASSRRAYNNSYATSL